MKNSNQITTFFAVIIAGAMIAGAIIYSGDNSSENTSTNTENIQAAVSESQKDEPETKKIVAGTSQEAHILGDPDAPIRIVEYSDIECPYCQRFHQTMHRIMDKYAATGQVAWEYRHFPLEMLHPTAPKEAEATECANEFGGNEKFWEYLDYLSENTIPKTNIEDELTKVAITLEIDEASFKSCLEEGRYTQKVQDSLEQGIETGVRGTPNSIILGPGGETQQIPGALPFEQVDAMIQQMLIQ